MRVPRALSAVLLPVAGIALWYTLTGSGLIGTIILPGPWAVAKAMVNELGFAKGNIWGAIGYSMAKAIVSFLIASTLGITIGLSMGASPKIYDTCFFSVDFLRSIPATAIFPFFVLTLGVGFESHVAYVSFPCIWINTISALYGVRHASAVRREMAHVFRASKGQVFRWVILPDALPYIAGGLRLSASISLLMVIAAEMLIGSAAGLGKAIQEAHSTLRLAEMYGLIIVTGLLGYALNRVLLTIEKHVVHWTGKDY